jgi:competence protein ComEC
VRRIAAFWVGALGCGLAWGWWSPNPPTRLAFLAVGQGDCAVLQTGGTAVLFDVGPKTETLDAGQRIVLPRLAGLGVDTVSLVVLTHPDIDHIGGLSAVLGRFPEARLAVSSAFRSHPALVAALRECKRAEKDVVWLGNETEVTVPEGKIWLSCPGWRVGQNDNDGSVFARITVGGATAVLSGDASSDVEVREIPGHQWPAQVLKAGHHGSATASSGAWLDAVKPRYAVISCGRANRYGHPHASVLERLRSYGVRTMRTDTDGDVIFERGDVGFVPSPR